MSLDRYFLFNRNTLIFTIVGAMALQLSLGYVSPSGLFAIALEGRYVISPGCNIGLNVAAKATQNGVEHWDRN